MPIKIFINTSTIKLDQFLKWADITQSGGEAKIIIKEGMVLLNGEVETKRGKLIGPGDVIEVYGKGTFQVISNGGAETS